jgi:hypothetical protein
MKPAISPTLLEAIDTIAQVLAKQRKRSVVINESSGSPRCMYRGEDNCMCAIGAAMPDEAYFPELEGEAAMKLISTVDTTEPLYEWLRSLEGEGDHKQLGRALGRMQRFHDHVATEEDDDAPTYTMMIVANANQPDAVLAADIKSELLRRVAAVYEVPAQ